MRNALTCSLLAFAISGCASLQPQTPAPTASASALPAGCSQRGADTGSHIVEKTSCNNDNVSNMSQSAYERAMRQAGPSGMRGN